MPDPGRPARQGLWSLGGLRAVPVAHRRVMGLDMQGRYHGAVRGRVCGDPEPREVTGMKTVTVELSDDEVLLALAKYAGVREGLEGKWLPSMVITSTGTLNEKMQFVGFSVKVTLRKETGR